MPVALTLRLARDGAMVPRADEQQPDLGVDDLVVTFRAIDPWALYSFIGRHRDAEAGPRADGRSSLLRFDFPVLTVNDNPKIAAVASVARVYIRVVVSAAGKRAPLAWPGPFPVSAPAWDAP
jgi:type VI secretion system protein ImpL